MIYLGDIVNIVTDDADLPPLDDVPFISVTVQNYGAVARGHLVAYFFLICPI